MGTYFACCKLLSDNSEDPNFVTAESVSEWVKLELKFIDSWMVHDNRVHIKTKSISFANLKHMLACKFFDRAFEVIAKKMGVSTEKLVAEAKSRMRSY